MIRFLAGIVFVAMICACAPRKLAETAQETAREKLVRVFFDDWTAKISFPQSLYADENNLTADSLEEQLRLRDEITDLKIKTARITDFDFSFIGRLPHIKHLWIQTENDSNVDLSFLQSFHNIEFLYLTLYDSYVIIDGALLRNLENLNFLRITAAQQIENLSLILELPNLDHLQITHYGSITIEPVSTESKLTKFYIDTYSDEIDLAYIGDLRHLNRLELITAKIINLDKITNPELETLYILTSDSDRQEFYQELDMNDLQNAAQLKSLAIMSSKIRINDLSPLLNLPHLETVHLSYDNVDITPLADSKSLKQIWIDNLDEVAAQIDIFKERGIFVGSSPYW